MSLVKLKSFYKEKIIVVGSANSGKTTFCAKHADSFTENYKKTIGVDIYVINCLNPKGNLVTFSCWLCAPQQRFEYYHHNFFRGAIAAIIMFDLSNKISFREIKKWKNSIYSHLGKVPVLLVGNKLDLKNKRVIPYEDARNYAERENFVGYIETSAEKDINVSEALEILNEIIYYFRKSGESVFSPKYLNRSVKIKIDRLKFN